MKYEEVWIDTSTEKIHAWWFPAQTKKIEGTILLFHGNGENLSTHFLSMMWIPQKGYNYLIFDYPGYWKSSGVPTQKGTVEAGRAALNWIRKNKDPRPIVYGQSLGGAIALRVVEDEKNNGPIRCLVLESTFSNYKRMAARVVKRSYITWIFHPLAYVLISNSYAVNDLENISPVPVFVIHGQKDHIVEPESGDEIFAALKEPKQMLKVENADHIESLWVEQGKYRKDLLEFFEKNK